MGSGNRKPPSEPPRDEGQKTEMLNVGKPPPEPPRRKAPTADPEPRAQDPNDGSTQMLDVRKPLPEVPKRKAPVAPAPIMATMIDAPKGSPMASPDDAPGATQMLKVDEPLPPPRRKSPPRAEDDAPPPPKAVSPARKAAPAPEGATQMLDIRHVPTPEEMRQQALKMAAQPSLPARRNKMPEEIEVPIEHLHEAIHEKAHEDAHGGHAHAGGGGNFTMMVALSSALIAVLAAISALMAGHYANESMIEQIKSSDQWSFYQAKSIKASVVQAKADILAGLGHPLHEDDKAKKVQYEEEKKEITKKATELEKESHHHLNQHQVLARTVTLLQISIALSAIAVLTKKKFLWYFSLLGGTAGLLILVQALFFTH